MKESLERRVAAAVGELLSKFPSDFARRSDEIKRQAEEIERAVKETEQSIDSGARRAGRRFRL